LCVSTVDDFTKENFKEVIDDNYVNPKQVKVVNFCSGKVYYDLLEKQQNEERKDVAIVRVEQLYPLPEDQLQAISDRYKGAKLNWVQEEPKNMGAWMHVLRYDWGGPLNGLRRKASPSPATGYASVHKREQAALVEAAFELT
jgi:2-oxoglutarate dehydrogenase E1 component